MMLLPLSITNAGCLPNNYGYGNASGYAEAYRNDPRGFFIH